MTEQQQCDNAIKWIEALLSGKYKQGKDSLGDEENGFCCWGLGCFVVGKEYYPDDGWDDSFAEYVGFLNSDGEIQTPLYEHVYLSDVNDNTRAGFKRIGKQLIKTAHLNFLHHVAEAIQKHFNKNTRQ